MRNLTYEEMRKRGCSYCTDMTKCEKGSSGSYKYICSYDECPYHELDKFDTYEDYLKSKESNLDFVLQ